ncbi:HAMP domain-containing histidine kinase [Parabacteroides sp. OttesenSCG-928-G06]|nr:HAMP domain-containing histidine kinase [Parabacteroides sp. OttesenSCG-928-K15]MDL2281522.1 HAMP domain-containing histidine kinase [Parabacteroides sp. OttesenSCG-928-G06]
MEKRIKIVWILSLVSALVVIGVQCYWLYTQYRYTIDTYRADTAQQILEAGDEEYNLRKEEYGGSFSYNIKRDTEYSDGEEGVRRKTMMAFSSGNPLPEQEEMNKKVKHLLDSVMQEVDNKSIEDMQVTMLVKHNPSQLSLMFPTDLPEDSIVIGMNRAFVNQMNPFREGLLDSVLTEKNPSLAYAFTPWVMEDTLSIHSFWENAGGIFVPAIDVYYAYSPFQRQGVKITAHIPVQPIFSRMVVQLLLSFGLVLLLIGCLVFQIKTILKQRKTGEMRQHFVTTMIHELKRPVQTLKTFVSFLGDREMQADEQMREQIIQDSMFELDNLSAYLNKLKDMVRADDEATPLHVSRFDLHELTDKVIRLTHLPAGKEVKFATRFEMESPFIEADPIHVANILSNLIENAIKYSAEKVEITIHACRRGNELWLTVSDNGIGIPLMEQEKVFVKFYRGSNMPDLAIPGLGLGLSYVKLISEAHHGSVSLNSRIGEGTSVTLCLPQ